jgi:hypothetical protein
MGGGQATLAMTGERRVDEHGAADRWNRGGIYDASGNFDLEATRTELTDRFQDVSHRLPEQVGEYTRGQNPREPYIAVYQRSGEMQNENGRNITRRVIRIFPRGPHLNEWTVGVKEEFGEAGNLRSFLHSHAMGLDKPSAAAATAVAVMQGKVPLNPRHRD